MAIAIDVGGRLLEAPALQVLVRLVGEVPDVEVVRARATDLDGAGFTEEVERFLEVLRINVDRSLDRSNYAG